MMMSVLLMWIATHQTGHRRPTASEWAGIVARQYVHVPIYDGPAVYSTAWDGRDAPRVQRLPRPDYERPTVIWGWPGPGAGLWRGPGGRGAVARGPVPQQQGGALKGLGGAITWAPGRGSLAGPGGRADDQKRQAGALKRLNGDSGTGPVGGGRAGGPGARRNHLN